MILGMFFYLTVLPGGNLPSQTSSGQVWDCSTLDPISKYSTAASGTAPSVSRTINDPAAKGSYSATASFVDGLPRFSLAAQSSKSSTGGVGEIDARYSGPQSITVSGFSAAVPTKMEMTWTLTGAATGSAFIAYSGPNATFIPGSESSSAKFAADVRNASLANGTKTFAGTASESFHLKGVNGQSAAFAIWQPFAVVDTGSDGPGAGNLAMIATSVAFPEFGGQTAADLGWTIAFLDGALPYLSDEPGGSATPEPQSILIFAVMLALGVGSQRRCIKTAML